MELREYIRIIGRWWWLLVVPILILSIGLAWSSHTQPVVFDSVAAMSFVKNTKAESQKPTYNYDNYYAVSESALLVETANGWLADPGTIASIYQTSHVSLPPTALNRYDRLIQVKRLPGATLTVTTTAGTEADANRLASEATKFVHARLTQLMNQGALDQVELFESAPIAQARGAGTTISALIGVVAGTLLGLISVFIAEYMRPSKP